MSGIQQPHGNESGEFPRKPGPWWARRRVPIVIGLLISGVFTFLFVRSLQVDVLKELPARIRYDLVLIAGLFFMAEFPLRALRWQILMSPLGRIPYRPLLTMTFIGFMANNLLPARAGELVRPILVARKLSLPLTPVLVTTVMERVFDLLGLLFVFLVMTYLLPRSGALAISPELMADLSRAGTLLGSAGLAGVVLLFVLAANEHVTRRLFERLASHLPGPSKRLALRLYEGLAAGLASFRGIRGPLSACILSIIMWMNGAWAIWIMTWSFNLELPFAAAAFQSVTLALAVALPQAPGFIGVWQVAVSETLKAWGVAVGAAQGFAVLFWLMSFVPVTVIGLLLLWREGLKFRELFGPDLAEPLEKTVVPTK